MSEQSTKRAAINRANAQRSTGPKSAPGKAASRENAWRHGMRSERAVMPGEDPGEFDALRHDLRQSYQPVGHHEEALVERIAIAEWKRRRFDAAEADIMWSILSCAEMGAKGDVPAHVVPERITRVILWANRLGLEKALELLTRYRAAVDRDWNRALSRLERLQRHRERLAREAAEAEAVLRVQRKTNDGLATKALAKILHVARRESILAGLGFESIARLTGMPDPETPTAWPSPGDLARMAGPGSGSWVRSATPSCPGRRAAAVRVSGASGGGTPLRR